MLRRAAAAAVGLAAAAAAATAATGTLSPSRPVYSAVRCSLPACLPVSLSLSFSLLGSTDERAPHSHCHPSRLPQPAHPPQPLHQLLHHRPQAPGRLVLPLPAARSTWWALGPGRPIC